MGPNGRRSRWGRGDGRTRPAGWWLGLHTHETRWKWRRRWTGWPRRSRRSNFCSQDRDSHANGARLHVNSCRMHRQSSDPTERLPPQVLSRMWQLVAPRVGQWKHRRNHHRRYGGLWRPRRGRRRTSGPRRLQRAALCHWPGREGREPGPSGQLRRERLARNLHDHESNCRRVRRRWHVRGELDVGW